MIKGFLWHSKAAQETQHCSLLWYGSQCYFNAGFQGSSKLFNKAPRGRKGPFMPLSCITTDLHRVDRCIPCQRKVPSMPYVQVKPWRAKHNEVQNCNFPKCMNITLIFISYHLCLSFEIVRHHYLHRTPHCRFREFRHFETEQSRSKYTSWIWF